MGKQSYGKGYKKGKTGGSGGRNGGGAHIICGKIKASHILV